jgi:hypothetical protein
MLESAGLVTRRTFVRRSVMGAAACLLSSSPLAKASRSKHSALFNGNDLDGWLMAENSQASLSSGDITDVGDIVTAIKNRSNAVAAYLDDALNPTVKNLLAAFDGSDETNVQATRSVLAKNLTEIIRGPAINERVHTQGAAVRPAAEQPERAAPTGLELVEMNRRLLVDVFAGAVAPVKAGWSVNGGAMASTGSGRGVIYTAHDYGRFRWIFEIRHISGNPDHQACVLIFCSRPAPNAIPLDALGGIQFQVPGGGHWDYRPGHNNAGDGEFTPVTKVSYDPHEWSRVEIVADAATGRARMAVAQPVGSKGVEVLDFSDPAAGKVGPIALQMHNSGLFDEYRDLTIEANPTTMELITTAQ